MKKLLLLSLLILFSCSKESDSESFFEKTAGKYFVDISSIDTDNSIISTVTKFNRQYLFQQMNYENDNQCRITSFSGQQNRPAPLTNLVEGNGEITFQRGTEFYKAQIIGTNPLKISINCDDCNYGVGSWIEIEFKRFTEIRHNWLANCDDCNSCTRSF